MGHHKAKLIILVLFQQSLQSHSSLTFLLQQASLVWIESEEENNFIMQEFEPLGTDPWLGYIKCNRSNPGTLQIF